MSVLESFHPAVAAWFRRTFDAPTPAQDAGVAGHTGRTERTGRGAHRVRQDLRGLSGGHRSAGARGHRAGALPDETRVVYVSPLKALSNDIQSNLLLPLEGIREELRASRTARCRRSARWCAPAIRLSPSVRAMRRRPPHIIVTTPESLYILLGSQSGRDMLATTRTVIVDEIHAIAGSKRGAHLAVSLERLAAVTGRAHPRRSVGDAATRSRRWRGFWSARAQPSRPRARSEVHHRRCRARPARAICSSNCRRLRSRR